MIEWSERFATGVPHLDQQHRMLFQMVGDFAAAMEVGRGEGVYREFLASLQLYARMHFGAEEECMLRFHCPAARANAAAHLQFRGLVEELRGEEGRLGFRRADALRAVAALEEWLVEHIGRIDTQLRPLVVDE